MPATDLRTAPRQERGRRRVDSLLDAAAALLDERDVGEMTTTEVAHRAGTSVGGLYRYFPDIETLLHALAERNRERYWAFAAETDEGARGRAFLDHLMTSYVRFARKEPGFRALRFGHVLENYLGQREASVAITDEMAAMIADRGGLVVTPELRLDIDIAVSMSVALMHRAFELDPDGDQRVIDKTISMVTHLFAPHVAPRD
ncbi:MAG: TetR family transcriptional regulator [Microbacteriaceae bacterium]|nr:TetR family transcriptional regulator [Microbacteriaceae bacterium]